MSTVTVPPVAPKPEIKEEATSLISRGVRARPLFDPEIMKRAIRESFVKLNPMTVAKNPVMFVVEVGAALTTIFVVKDAFRWRWRHPVWHSNRVVAVVHGCVCELRRSNGRGAGEGSGGRIAQNQDRHDGAEASAQ